MPLADAGTNSSGLGSRRAIGRRLQDFTPTEVYRVDEMFCTGTMGDLAAVTRADVRTIGDGNMGPTPQRIDPFIAEPIRSRGYVIA